MIDPEEFARTIDKPFWKHITRSTHFLDPIKYIDIDKDEFLRKVAADIRKHSYNFSLPAYVYYPKDNGVLRRLKSFSLSDTCVYYYCVKSLQDELVSHISRNPHVYGGFRFTPDLRLSENALERMTYDAQYEGFAKNRFRKYWNEYTRLAAKIGDDGYQHYIHIDIAHFYDDINLDLLEKSVRNVAVGKEEVVDLLFHFLRNSDRGDLGYAPTSVGVPQEDVGEMSRLLANFYLSSFDARIRAAVSTATGLKDGNDFFYTRYADDMWVAVNADENICKRIIQTFSSELLRLKLHISEKKLTIYSHAKYTAHWRFDAWEELQEAKRDPRALLRLMKKLSKKQEGRWYSAFLYALKVFTGNPDNARFLATPESARHFMAILLNHSRVFLSLEQKTEPFFKRLLSQHLSVRNLIIAHVLGGQNLYPAIEYKLLHILGNCCDFNEEIYLFFKDILYKSIKQDYQWYSRTIALNFLASNLEHIEAGKAEELRRLVKHLGDSEPSRSDLRERRATIIFLMRIRNEKGQSSLKKYALPSDIALQNYLRESAS